MDCMNDGVKFLFYNGLKCNCVDCIEFIRKQNTAFSLVGLDYKL